jgi:hypothetical protein
LDEIKIKANVLVSFAERKVVEAVEAAEDAAQHVEEAAKKAREEL